MGFDFFCSGDLCAAERWEGDEGEEQGTEDEDRSTIKGEKRNSDQLSIAPYYPTAEIGSPLSSDVDIPGNRPFELHNPVVIPR